MSVGGDYQQDDFNDIADDTNTIRSDPIFRDNYDNLLTKSPNHNQNNKAKALQENSPEAQDLFEDNQSTIPQIPLIQKQQLPQPEEKKEEKVVSKVRSKLEEYMTKKAGLNIQKISSYKKLQNRSNNLSNVNSSLNLDISQIKGDAQRILNDNRQSKNQIHEIEVTYLEDGKIQYQDANGNVHEYLDEKAEVIFPYQSPMIGKPQSNPEVMGRNGGLDKNYRSSPGFFNGQTKGGHQRLFSNSPSADAKISSRYMNVNQKQAGRRMISSISDIKGHPFKVIDIAIQDAKMVLIESTSEFQIHGAYALKEYYIQQQKRQDNSNTNQSQILKNEDLWNNVQEVDAERAIVKLKSSINIMRNAINFAEAEYFKLMKNQNVQMFNRKGNMVSQNTSLGFNGKAGSDDHNSRITYNKDIILGRKQIEKKNHEELYLKLLRRHQIITQKDYLYQLQTDIEFEERSIKELNSIRKGISKDQQVIDKTLVTKIHKSESFQIAKIQELISLNELYNKKIASLKDLIQKSKTLKETQERQRDEARTKENQLKDKAINIGIDINNIQDNIEVVEETKSMIVDTKQLKVQIQTQQGNQRKAHQEIKKKNEMFQDLLKAYAENEDYMTEKRKRATYLQNQIENLIKQINDAKTTSFDQQTIYNMAQIKAKVRQIGQKVTTINQEQAEGKNGRKQLQISKSITFSPRYYQEDRNQSLPLVIPMSEKIQTMFNFNSRNDQMELKEEDESLIQNNNQTLDLTNIENQQNQTNYTDNFNPVNDGTKMNGDCDDDQTSPKGGMHQMPPSNAVFTKPLFPKVRR
ncbi:UNKNOWN [Stylonychia lemnae]|uniref:Uncharacterized protein n=1 Tax=Stylonychia lemnae TaxID=5949 RepID=A0A078ART6_STYLE|nr:UNKNOWN [Stylonychia lemnae]|eukprot:CDW84701.1 UNKNOWN [Stylonychia lemnae]